MVSVWAANESMISARFDEANKSTFKERWELVCSVYIQGQLIKNRTESEHLTLVPCSLIPPLSYQTPFIFHSFGLYAL